MTCFNPKTIYIRNSTPLEFQTWSEQDQHKFNRATFKPKKGFIPIQVPCGDCLGCKLDHANMWATRCVLEAQNWPISCMITLTYNDKNLPKTKDGKPTLYKKDVQDFIKRLRYHEKGFAEWKNPKTHKIEKPIRYFYCGEYGSKGRSHYHILIFNWSPKDLKLYKYNKHNDPIFKSKTLYDGEAKGYWGKGFCTVSLFHYNTACYVARYCTKKAGLGKRNQFRVPMKTPKIDKKGYHTQYYKNPNKPLDIYINMSTGCGIGYKYWLEHTDFLKKWRYIELKVDDKIKHQHLPRYFLKKWKEEDWESYEQAKYEDFKHGEEHKHILVELDNLDNSLTFEEKWKIHINRLNEKLTRKTTYAGILKRDNVEEPNGSTTLASSRYAPTDFVVANQETRETKERWKRIFERWRDDEINLKLIEKIFKKNS